MKLNSYYLKWMSFYKDHALLWKRAAKKWYAMYEDAEMCEEYFEKMAASRLELLKRWNTDRVEKGIYCPFCHQHPEVIAVDMLKNTYSDIHAEGCELAEELGDD